MASMTRIPRIRPSAWRSPRWPPRRPGTTRVSPSLRVSSRGGPPASSAPRSTFNRIGSFMPAGSFLMDFGGLATRAIPADGGWLNHALARPTGPTAEGPP